MSRLENVRATVRAEWTDAARVAAWRKWHRQFAVQARAAADALVREAQPGPGMKVLDLASGSGEPAITLASLVEPGGHVTATDLVPGMLATAEENARQQGVSNISFQQADAESLPFPASSFDVVTCRFGLMFVPDVGGALREIRRVLKPAGRAVFVAWGPREQNPIFTTTTGVLMKYVEVPAPEPDTPEGYRFASPGTLSSALREAGFHQVSEEALTVPWPWPGPVEEAWEGYRDLRGESFRRILEKIPSEQLPRVMHEIYAAMRAYFDGRQVNFHAAIVLASGVP